MAKRGLQADEKNGANMTDREKMYLWLGIVLGSVAEVIIYWY